MKDTMVVTVNAKNDEVAYFKIQFLKADFFKVVDSIDNLNMINIYNNKLWNVV